MYMRDSKVCKNLESKLTLRQNLKKYGKSASARRVENPEGPI